MVASDVTELLLGVAWVLFGLPYFMWAWAFSKDAFVPKLRIWARLIVWSLLVIIYVYGFIALGAVARSEQAPSIIAWNPFAAGVLLGVVLLVLILRYGNKE
jgi:hypothetical protein